MNIKKAVIDSSVLVAVLTPEEYSEWAEEILDKVDEWISPELVYYEVANAIWKKYKKLKVIGRKEAYEAIDKALDTLKHIIKTYSYSELLKESFKTADELNITVYDAVYIALAKKLNAKFITLDEELYRRLEDTEYSKIIITPMHKTT